MKYYVQTILNIRYTKKIGTCWFYVIFGAEFRYESNGQESSAAVLQRCSYEKVF